MKEIVDKLNEILEENPNLFKNKLIRYCKSCNKFIDVKYFESFICDTCLPIYRNSKSREFYSRNSKKVIERVTKYNHNKIIKEFKEKQNNDTKSRTFKKR